jgi:hypothetical protein
VCESAKRSGAKSKSISAMHANADDDLALSLPAEVIADLLEKSALHPKDKAEIAANRNGGVFASGSVCDVLGLFDHTS